MADVIEKVSDIAIKIISTTQQVVTKITTISELKKERISLEAQKTNITDNYNNQIASLDEKIAVVDTQITQARALSVKEVDVEGNII